MKSKRYVFIGFSLALALLGWKSGVSVAAEVAVPEISERGTVDVMAGGADGPDEPTCVMIQRASFGQVKDCDVWAAQPEVNHNNLVLYTGVKEAGEKRSLVHFDLDFLPAGVRIESALFGLWSNGTGSGETIRIYRITAPWSEDEPTWNSFAEAYDDAVEWGSFVPGGPGFIVTDLTALASTWVAGQSPNYGLMLRNTLGQTLDEYASSEAGSVGPWLAVCYTLNHAPVAEDDLVATDEDTPVTAEVLNNDHDPDGDPLTVIEYDTTSSQGGTVGCTDGGACTYTPISDFNGIDTFGYTASDGRGGSASATVTVTVAPVNDPPVAVDDPAATDVGMAVVIGVIENDHDPDGDPLDVCDHDPTSAAGGGVGCTGAGECTYDPPSTFSGTDTFSYTVCDGKGGSDSATVEIAVGGGGPAEYHIYLPLVTSNFPPPPLPPAPDLVVARITATNDDVEVVIKNQGDRPVPSSIGFWVDLYVAPDPVPTGVNQTWETCATEGMVWGVPQSALPLEPGGEITLRMGDGFYWSTLSTFSGTFLAGTPIYVHVDSANTYTTYGAVLENHEIVDAQYNNIDGPVFPAVAALSDGLAGGSAAEGDGLPGLHGSLPSRP